MQIFYLETNEEVPSIIDRITKALDTDIALVVPKGALLIQSIVNLKLIKRECEKIGKSMVLVTSDKIGRNLASQVGISVYERIEKGQATDKVTTQTSPHPTIETKTTEEKISGGIKIHRYYTDLGGDNEDRATEKIESQAIFIKDSDEKPAYKRISIKVARSKLLAKIILIVVIVVLLGASGAAVWALPLTSIEVSLKSENYSKESTIALASSPGADQLKAQVLQSEKSGTKTTNSTGTKDVGEKAHGSVVIYNEYSSSTQPLQAGTRMQNADGKVFRLSGDIAVPGGTFEVEGATIKLKAAGTVTAEAQADAPGDSFNIGASTLSIPSIGREDKIYAKTSGFTGGVSKTVKVVTDSDISDAKIDLTNQLIGQTQEEITKKVAGTTIIDSSLEKNITAFSTTKNAGDEANSFEARATVKIRILTYINNDLEKLIKANVKSELEPNEDFVLNSDNLQIEAKDINLNESKANLKIKAEGKKVAKLDQKELEQTLHGKSLAEINKILKDLPQFESAKVNFTPTWWFQRIPSRQKSLYLQIKYE